MTIDLDGTVVRTGNCVDGAERGYNPHHPKDPSYFPLTALWRRRVRSSM
ncbi:MAG: hypothetical protein IPK00_25415 [Deltaproteobacteria bacterium]|nr:hypothetical protein [Deltaproteobacteria bacterium]